MPGEYKQAPFEIEIDSTVNPHFRAIQEVYPINRRPDNVNRTRLIGENGQTITAEKKAGGIIQTLMPTPDLFSTVLDHPYLTLRVYGDNKPEIFQRGSARLVEKINPLLVPVGADIGSVLMTPDKFYPGYDRFPQRRYPTSVAEKKGKILFYYLTRAGIIPWDLQHIENLGLSEEYTEALKTQNNIETVREAAVSQFFAMPRRTPQRITEDFNQQVRESIAQLRANYFANYGITELPTLPYSKDSRKKTEEEREAELQRVIEKINQDWGRLFPEDFPITAISLSDARGEIKLAAWFEYLSQISDRDIKAIISNTMSALRRRDVKNVGGVRSATIEELAYLDNMGEKRARYAKDMFAV